MRLLVFANNWIGWQGMRCLVECGEEIAGLVLHPPERRRYGSEILETAGLPASRILEAPELHRAQTLETIRGWAPELGVSLLFGYVLRRPVLDLLPGGAINLHPSYLPFNRGAHPNVWSIVEGTPAGVSLHHVSEHMDGGDLIAQRRVPAEPVDTGETLYRRLEREAVALFRDWWPRIAAGEAPRTPQHAGEGTFHRVRDLERLDRIDLDRTYTARELIDLLRARTFPPYDGAWFESGGRKVLLRLQLEYASEESGASEKIDD